MIRQKLSDLVVNASRVSNPPQMDGCAERLLERTFARTARLVLIAD